MACSLKPFAAREAPQLLDQLGVGATIGRSDPDEDAIGGSLAREEVRPGRAWMDV